MFFRVTAFKTLLVPPQDLGHKLIHNLHEMLRASVEGTHIPYVGRVIAVTDVLEPHNVQAKIVDSGDAAIVVNYEAIVFKLFNDEYVDVIVTEVTPEGFHGRVGPANVLTPTIHMPRFKFDQHGPVMQFVDMEGGATIRDGVVVRVRIVSETPGRDIDAMASMDGQFLCVR